MTAQQNSWSAIPQSVRDALRAYVFERDGWRCQVGGPRCTVQATELDHVRPRGAGGSVGDVGNMRAACMACNRGRRVDGPPRSCRVHAGCARNHSRDW